jgi:hypothetical protein
MAGFLQSRFEHALRFLPARFLVGGAAFYRLAVLLDGGSPF